MGFTGFLHLGFLCSLSVLHTPLMRSLHLHIKTLSASCWVISPLSDNNLIGSIMYFQHITVRFEWHTSCNSCFFPLKHLWHIILMPDKCINQILEVPHIKIIYLTLCNCYSDKLWNPMIKQMHHITNTVTHFKFITLVKYNWFLKKPWQMDCSLICACAV